MKSQNLVNDEHPYLGLKAFNEDLRTYFYGRAKETQDLFRLVEKNVSTVLFGKSGLGKTSLLQAGLMPLLRKNYLLPISLRINFSDEENSPLQQVKDMIEKMILDADKNALHFEDMTLWEYFHRLKILSGFVKPVLIFDQFEELFTLGRLKQKQVNELITELANLIENQIPIQVQEKYKNNELPFSFQKQNFKIIFSLREDYLSQIENLNALIPSLRKSKLRLMQLNRENAVEAVLQPGKHIINSEEAEKLVEMILLKTVPNYVKDEEQEEIWESYHIEPFLLSLICFQVNEFRLESKSAKISSDLLNRIDIEKIIKSFYYQSTHDLGKDAKKIVEDALLTQDGYRKLQHKSDLLLISGVTEDDVRKLIDRRIIRNEIWNGREHLELIHDVLVPIVKESRDIRAEEERRIKQEEQMLEFKRREEEKHFAELRKMEEEKRVFKKQQRQKTLSARRFAFAIGIGLIASSIFAFIANNQRNIAEHNERLSNSNMIAVNALLETDNDPTLGFRLAEKAYQIDNTTFSSAHALRKAYYSGNMYEIIQRTNDLVADISFSADGKYLAWAFGDSIAIQTIETKSIFKFKAHSQIINSLCFSPLSNIILSCSNDSSAALWDINGTKLKELKEHTNTIVNGAFTANGKFIITASSDNTAILWNSDGTKFVQTEKHNRDVYEADFSPLNNYIVLIGLSNELKICNLEGKFIDYFEFKGIVNTVRISPNEKFIAAASKDSSLLLWQYPDNEPIIFKQQNIIKKLNFLNDSLIACYGEDNNVRIVNLKGETVNVLKGHTAPVTRTIIEPSGNYFITASKDKTIRQWKILKQEEDIFIKFLTLIRYATFSPREDKLLVASGNTASLWNLDGSKQTEFVGHNCELLYATFSHNGNKVVTCDIDGFVRLWNINGELIEEIQAHEARAVWASFSKNDELLVTAGWDSTANVWNMNGEKVMQLKHNEEIINSAEFSPNDNSILTSAENIAVIWDKNGKRITNFVGHRDIIQSAKFSSDGKLVVTASYDKTAIVWTLDGAVKLKLIGHDGEVSDADISPDGKYFVTVSADRTVKLWDDKGSSVFTYIGHHEGIFSVSFFNRGKYILSVSEDKTIRKWFVDPEEIIRKVNNDKIFGEPWQLDEEAITKYQLERLIEI